MGFLSSITNTLFGDSGEGAAKSQASQNAADRAFIAEQTLLARQQAVPLFNQSQMAQRLGSQQALDALSGGFSSQLDAFQQGNVGAQQTIGGGQDAFSRAILGLPPLEQQAPVSFDFDTSFIPKNIQFGNTVKSTLGDSRRRREERQALREEESAGAALGGLRGFGGIRGRR